MSGLDQMIQRIEEQAGAQASEILRQAKQEADQIAAEAETERKEAVSRIAQQAGPGRRRLQRTSRCFSGSTAPHALLTAKQALIADALEKSYEALLACRTAGISAFWRRPFPATYKRAAARSCSLRRIGRACLRAILKSCRPLPKNTAAA